MVKTQRIESNGYIRKCITIGVHTVKIIRYGTVPVFFIRFRHHAPCKIHSVALSTLFQVLLRALVSIVVQFQWRPALDDAIAMYFLADPASLHSFPPCLLYQQRGVLVIVPVKKYRLLFIRFITGIFGRGIGTLTVRVYRCGPLYNN